MTRSAIPVLIVGGAPAGVQGRWLVNLLLPPGQEPPRDSLSHAEIVRRAIGEQPFELIQALPWTAGGFVAQQMRLGPVFLVGDAAHVMTPAGGFGMNTAFQDAHNLAWKLAALLAGHAAPSLLDSYESERLPVARPGHRAPHCWLNSERTQSTLDLFGERFLLLAGPRGRPWLPAAEAVATQQNVPLAARLSTEAPAWCALYGVDEDGAVLVRPDGVVAWCEATGATNPEALATALAVALGQLLGWEG